MTKTPTPVSGITSVEPLSNNVVALVASRKPSNRLQRVSPERFQDFDRRHGQSGRKEDHASGHETFTYGELLKRNFAPAPWLFEGLMRTNEVAMVYAATGVGKTWLTLSLSMIAAGGGTLLNWSNDIPRKVLYLDGEMDAGELVARMNSLAGGLKCDPEALAQNFVLCPRQMQRKVTGSFVEIETEDDQLGLLQFAQENDIALIVIDNLTTLSGQLDENASKDMKGFNQFLLRAKQRGLGVLVVHHQGKGRDSGPRGSTAMVATLNLMLKLEGSTQERAAGDTDAKFTVMFEKNRGKIDSRPIPVKVTRAVFGDATDTQQDDAVVLMVDDDADSHGHRVKRLLQSGQYKNQVELGKAIGCNQSTVSKYITKALA